MVNGTLGHVLFPFAPMAKGASRRRQGSKSQEQDRKERIEPLYGLVGQQIGQTRRGQGWTQEELAEAVGISQNMLARIESGSRRVPLHNLAAIADALEVPLVDLLPAGEQEPPRVSAKLLEAFKGLSRDDQALLRPLVERLRKESTEARIGGSRRTR